MSRKSAWTIGIVAAAVATGLYLSRGPWVAYRAQKQKADVASREMMKAEQGSRQLLEQKARMDSPLGREEAARAKGYVRKDETPIDSGG